MWLTQSDAGRTYTKARRMNEQVELELRLDSSDAEAHELAGLTAQLREELLELDVHRVDLMQAGDAPPGTRAGEVAAIGALLVSTAGHVVALAKVVDTVRGWLARIGWRTVKISLNGDVLEVTGVSSIDQQELIQA
jgi:hypothetical protein